MFLDSTIVFSALAGLALQVGGVEMNATFLQANQPGCVIAAQRAKDWRQEGKLAVEQRIGKWCVAGTVQNDYWVAEQWDADAPPSRAQGWRVRIPIRQIQNTAQAANHYWPFTVLDRHLNVRLQMRHSLQTLDDHHQASLLNLEKQIGRHSGAVQHLPDGRLTTFDQGQILLSGRDPLRGSYSILIQR